MKKIMLIIYVVSCNLSFSQENNVAQLIDLLHNQQIEMIAKSAEDFSPNANASDIVNNVIELKKQLSALYTKYYTSSEVESLVLFYKSKVGKKLLENQKRVNSKASKKIFKWESKLQGIEIIEEDLTLENTEADFVDASVEKELDKSRVTPKVILPKVNSIADLKKLIKEDGNILLDSQFLAQLLDVEDALNPITEIDEALPETDTKRNN